MFARLIVGLLLVVPLVPVAQACTAFVVYRNGLALAGNNEDFWETDTKLWFVPKDGSNRGVAGKLGRVYFGFDNFYPQGGMNEAGLFFDGFATAENKVKNSLDRPYFAGNIADYVIANCETVAEVIAVFEKHNLSILNHAMLMFGDQHGDSVIIEGDEFLRIEGDHQVVTNFYQSQITAGKTSCSRYRAAIKALAKGDPVSVEFCRDVLAKTRQNGRAPTQYSNVYDLKKRLVYLYHFHNFEELVCLNLAEELAKGAHEVDLPSLFSEHDAFTAFKDSRQQDIRDQIENRRWTDANPASFKDFVGSYTFEVDQANQVEGQFSIQDNRLFISSKQEGEEKQEEIYPEAEDRFFRIGDYGLETYTFKRNDKNRVTKVILRVFGRKIEGTRLE